MDIAYFFILEMKFQVQKENDKKKICSPFGEITVYWTIHLWNVGEMYWLFRRQLLPLISVLQIEAAGCSKTSEYFCQTTRRHIPEDNNHSHRNANLIFRTEKVYPRGTNIRFFLVATLCSARNLVLYFGKPRIGFLMILQHRIVLKVSVVVPE